MKKVNFANALPEKMYREVRQWFTITCALLATGAGVILVLNLAHIPELRRMAALCEQLRAQAAHIESHAPQTGPLKAEHELLTKKIDKVRRRHSHRKSPLPFLETLQKEVAHAIRVERFHIGKHAFELTTSSNTPHEMKLLASHLGEIPSVESVEIATLKQEESKAGSLRCTSTIKGRIVGKKKSA